MYFVTFTVVNWIDVFTRNIYKDLFIESLSFCIKEKGLKVYAFCIMTHHIHTIISANGENKLEDII
jgi:putative transposase